MTVLLGALALVWLVTARRDRWRLGVFTLWVVLTGTYLSLFERLPIRLAGPMLGALTLAWLTLPRVGPEHGIATLAGRRWSTGVAVAVLAFAVPSLLTASTTAEVRSRLAEDAHAGVRQLSEHPQLRAVALHPRSVILERAAPWREPQPTAQILVPLGWSTLSPMHFDALRAVGVSDLLSAVGRERHVGFLGSQRHRHLIETYFEEHGGPTGAFHILAHVQDGDTLVDVMVDASVEGDQFVVHSPDHEHPVRFDLVAEPFGQLQPREPDGPLRGRAIVPGTNRPPGDIYVFLDGELYSVLPPRSDGSFTVQIPTRTIQVFATSGNVAGRVVWH